MKNLDVLRKVIDNIKLTIQEEQGLNDIDYIITISIKQAETVQRKTLMTNYVSRITPCNLKSHNMEGKIISTQNI